MVRIRCWRRGWAACFGAQSEAVRTESLAVDSSQLRAEAGAAKGPDICSERSKVGCGWPQRHGLDTSLSAHGQGTQGCVEQRHGLAQEHTLHPAASLDRDSDLTSSHSILEPACSAWQPVHQPEQQQRAATCDLSGHALQPAAALAPAPSPQVSARQGASVLPRALAHAQPDMQRVDISACQRAASLPSPTPAVHAVSHAHTHTDMQRWSDSGSRSDDYDVHGNSPTDPCMLSSQHCINPPSSPPPQPMRSAAAPPPRSADSAIKQARRAATAVAAALGHQAELTSQPIGHCTAPRHARVMSVGAVPIAALELLVPRGTEHARTRKVTTCTGSSHSYGIYSDLVASRRMSSSPAASPEHKVVQAQRGPASRLLPPCSKPAGAVSVHAADGGTSSMRLSGPAATLRAPARPLGLPMTALAPDHVAAVTHATAADPHATALCSSLPAHEIEPHPAERESPCGRSSCSEPRPIKDPAEPQPILGSSAASLRLPNRALGSGSLRLQERHRDMIQLGLQAEAERLALGQRLGHGGAGRSSSTAGAAPGLSAAWGPGPPCGSSPASASMVLSRFFEEGSEERDEERDRREATLQYLHHLVSANSRGWQDARRSSTRERCILGCDPRAPEHSTSLQLGPLISQSQEGPTVAAPGDQGDSAPLPSRHSASNARGAMPLAAGRSDRYPIRKQEGRALLTGH